MYDVFVMTFDENELNESFKPGNPAAIFDRRYVGSVRRNQKIWQLGISLLTLLGIAQF